MKWGWMLLALMMSSQASGMAEVSVLAVGSNDSYKKSLPKLLYAEDDALRFVEAMKTVGLVPTARATTLQSPTVAEFRQVLQHMSKPSGLGVSDQGRKFIFYYSGHADETGIHLADGLITKKELHSSLGELGANTKIAIIDSCFSGALTAKGVEPAPAFELPKVEFDEPSGSVFLSSAAGRQFSYESDKLESSIFTHHLIAGLYGEADGNVDGVVTVDELYQYVYRNTRWQSLNLPIKESQRPEITASLQGQGAVVLSFPSQTNSRLAFEKAVEGEVTIASAKGIQYFRVEKENGKQKVLQLPAGSYRVSIRKGERVGRSEVDLQPTRISFLSHDDFDWSQEKPEAIAEKGAAVTATKKAPEPEDDFSYWITDFGGHTGFVNNRPQPGPYFMGAVRWPIGEVGFLTNSLFVGLSYHRNQYSEDPIGEETPKDEFSVIDDDPVLVTESSGAWFGFWPEINFKRVGWSWLRRWMPRLTLDLKIAYGQTHHHQRWYGESVGGGAAPAFQVGSGLIYTTKGGLGIGIRATSERLNGERVSQVKRPQGESVALTFHY